MYAEEIKSSRNELADLVGKKVPFIGRFIDVRILNNKFINLLFRDVIINDIHYDHLWVVYNDNFRGKNIKHNCIISCIGTVEKYDNCDRYGIAYCHNIEIIGYDEKCEDNYSNMWVKLRNVNYKSCDTSKNSNLKGYQQFEVDYGLDNKTKIRLVYNPLNTLRNRNDEIEFDFYDEFGKMAEFSKVSFNPIRDMHKISIDDKYYVSIKETIYRQLCLLYFLSTNAECGCMSYIPYEVMEDYVEVVDKNRKNFFYRGELVFSVNKDINSENNNIIEVCNNG